MHRKTIFKGLAITNFIVLLGLFLMFRNGVFDKYIYEKNEIKADTSNTQSLKQTDIDTTIVEPDSIFIQRLMSSKSMVIIDGIKSKFKPTFTKKDSSKLNEEKASELIMYSSKSALIIDPNIFKKDSLIFKQSQQKIKK